MSRRTGQPAIGHNSRTCRPSYRIGQPFVEDPRAFCNSLLTAARRRSRARSPSGGPRPRGVAETVWAFSGCGASVGPFSRRPAGRRACSAAPRHVEPMTHGDAPYRACAPPDAVPCPDRRSGRASMHRQPGIGRCCEGHPGRLHRRSNPLVRQWRMPAQTIAV